MSDKVYWTIAGFAYIAAITGIDNLMPDAAWYWQMLMLIGTLVLMTTLGAVGYEFFAILRMRRFALRVRKRALELADQANRASQN